MKRSGFLRTLIAIPFAAKVAIESKMFAVVKPAVDQRALDAMLMGANIGAGNHYLQAKARHVGATFFNPMTYIQFKPCADGLEITEIEN